MKRIDRYISTSVIKISVVTMALIILVMMLFDAFSHLDQYMNMEVPTLQMVILTLLEAPQAVILGLGPALLFSTTYVLSMLQANNELIVLYNAGYSYRRLIVSCIIIAMAASLFQFGFNETVAITAFKKKQLLSNDLFGIGTAYDNRNVTLRSEDGSYIIHAGRYYDENQRITNVTVVYLDEQKAMTKRVNAPSASYNGTNWVLQDAVVYSVNPDGPQLEITQNPIYSDEQLDLESGLFRNLEADIAVMDLSDAIKYVKRIQVVDPFRYISYATDLQERVWTHLTPLILTVISCSTLFRWKKNVLILSIISSLSIAVVFFVAKMVATIFSKQGIISPIAGAVAPLVLMLVISVIAGLCVRK